MTQRQIKKNVRESKTYGSHSRSSSKIKAQSKKKKKNIILETRKIASKQPKLPLKENSERGTQNPKNSRKKKNHKDQKRNE